MDQTRRSALAERVMQRRGRSAALEGTRSFRLQVLAAAIAVSLLAGAQGPADASAKLRNGLIAYSQPNCQGGDFEFVCPSRVFVVRPDGGGNRRLPCSAPSFGSCYDGTPTFSPNGRQLATGTLGARRDLIAIRSPTGKVRKRIATSRGIVDLGWGASGRRLFFIDNGSLIQSTPLTGGRKSVFRRVPGVADLAVSRQGRLAWTTDARKGIFITNHARTRVRRINAAGAFPAWSPDGRKLVFRYGDPVFTINADGSNRRRLTKRCTFDGRMAWSPDGSKIACSTDAGRLPAIDVRNRRARAITPAGAVFAEDIDWQARP